MSHFQLDKDRRKVLKMALTSVAAVPLSSLLLNSQTSAGDLPPESEDDPAAKGLGYVHDS